MTFVLKKTSHAQSNFQESKKRLRRTRFPEIHMAYLLWYNMRNVIYYLTHTGNLSRNHNATVRVKKPKLFGTFGLFWTS